MRLLLPKNLSGTRAVVIGSGVAGMAAAVVLSARGARVRVLEQAPAAGGLLVPIRVGGHAFSVGEEAIVSPRTLGRLFGIANQRLSDFVEFEPLDPAARILIPGEEPFDVTATGEKLADTVAQSHAADGARLRRLWPRWEQQARALEEYHLHAVGGGPAGAAARMGASPTLWPAGLLTARRGTLARMLRKKFAGPAVPAAFDWALARHGASAHLAPAVALLPAVLDLSRGVWRPKGGMDAVRGALLRLLQMMDIRVQCGATVQRIETQEGRVRGVTGEGFRPLGADVVVYTGDPRTAFEELIPKTDATRKRVRQLDHWRPGRSAFSIFLLFREDPGWTDAPREIMLAAPDPIEPARQIDHWRVPAAQPPVHLYRDAAEDGRVAVRIVTPQPAASPRWRWNEDTIGAERERLFARLAEAGFPVPEDRIAHEVILTPPDLAAAHGLSGGILTGPSWSARRGIIGRPGNDGAPIHGLRFAGSSVHPGATLTEAVASGMLAAEI